MRTVLKVDIRGRDWNASNNAEDRGSWQECCKPNESYIKSDSPQKARQSNVYEDSGVIDIIQGISTV